MPHGFLRRNDGMHRHLFDAGARSRIRRKRQGITSELRQKTCGDYQGSANDAGWKSGDVAHLLQLALPGLQAGGQFLGAALEVFWLNAGLSACADFFIELNGAMRQVIDFLDQPLAYCGVCAINLAGAPAAYFLIVLGNDVLGTAKARASSPESSQLCWRIGAIRAKSAASNGSRSRCGAHPAKRTWLLAVTETNCNRLDTVRALEPLPSVTL